MAVRIGIIHDYDDRECTLSTLDHGRMVCIHGYRVSEVWVDDDDPPILAALLDELGLDEVPC